MSKSPWKTFAIIFLGILLCISVVSSRFMANAISKSTIASLNIQVRDLKVEIENWKKLYTEVYSINKDYIKATKEISDILYMTNMPVGGVLTNQITDKFNQKILDGLVSSLKINRDTLNSIKVYFKTRQKIINEFPFGYPLKKGGTVAISSGFGLRVEVGGYPVVAFTGGTTKDNKSQLDEHAGIDLVADVGDLVMATADGVVEYIELNNPDYGKLVIIKHILDYKTYYAHLSEINVKRGQKVKNNDIIGKIGNTGKTTGPHLHYEVRIGDMAIDPLPYLSVSY